MHNSSSPASTSTCPLEATSSSRQPSCMTSVCSWMPTWHSVNMSDVSPAATFSICNVSTKSVSTSTARSWSSWCMLLSSVDLTTATVSWPVYRWSCWVNYMSRLFSQRQRQLSDYLYLKRCVIKVSCSSKACDWTTGRNRSHSNSSQLTDKWGVGCCIIFMATNDVTKHVA